MSGYSREHVVQAMRSTGEFCLTYVAGDGAFREARESLETFIDSTLAKLPAEPTADEAHVRALRELDALREEIAEKQGEIALMRESWLQQQTALRREFAVGRAFQDEAQALRARVAELENWDQYCLRFREQRREGTMGRYLLQLGMGFCGACTPTTDRAYAAKYAFDTEADAESFRRGMAGEWLTHSLVVPVNQGPGLSPRHAHFEGACRACGSRDVEISCVDDGPGPMGLPPCAPPA